MAGISSKAALSSLSAYKYNAGSELEDEGGLNYYNTFYRKYDAQIGRFTGVDMLAEYYNGLTPFQFADNNPILFNDPTGAMFGRSEKGPDGNYHVGWVNEMLWNNLGFFDFGNESASGGGGGHVFRTFSDISSTDILNNMHFGETFGQRKKTKEYGFWVPVSYWEGQSTTQWTESTATTEGSQSTLGATLVLTKDFVSISDRLGFSYSTPAMVYWGDGGFAGNGNTQKTEQNTQKRKEKNFGGADYVSVSVSVAGAYGINISITEDKFGNTYCSPGFAFGAPIGPGSASFTWNSLGKPNVSEAELSNFLSGFSANGSVGCGTGVSGSWSPGNGVSTGIGFYTPQVGGSLNYTPSWLIFH